MTHGLAEIEVGKRRATFTMINDGIKELEEAKARLAMDKFDVGQIERMERQSKKLRSLKLIDQEASLDQEAFKLLKKHLSTLKKLRIVLRNKIDKSQPQVDIAKLQKQIEQVLKGEKKPVIKDLEVPDNLLCQISGDLMKDPVLIESGMTYEREAILQYIEVQAERAEAERE